MAFRAATLWTTRRGTFMMGFPIATPLLPTLAPNVRIQPVRPAAGRMRRVAVSPHPIGQGRQWLAGWAGGPSLFVLDGLSGFGLFGCIYYLHDLLSRELQYHSP